MSEILMLSSGLDSLIAFFYLGEPKCVHCTNLSRYSWRERQVVERFRRELGIDTKIVNLDWLEKFEEPDATIPARNLILASVGAYFGDTIYLVAQRGEQDIPDRSPKFFAATSQLLSTLHQRPKVVDPVFGDKTKCDMVEWALENGVSEELLQMSYSCFRGLAERCGECKACARMSVALDYNSILPDDFFAKDIWEWSGWQEYKVNLLAGRYEERRTQQTLQVLQRRGL